MKIVNNRFWRLAPARGTDHASLMESPVLNSPAEFIAKLKHLDGIVIGVWDPDAEHGKVDGLGVVQEVDDRTAVVDWRRTCFTLRPTGAGATQWRKRPFFQFVDVVAERYKLRTHFNEAFAHSAPDGHAGTSDTPMVQDGNPSVAVQDGPTSRDAPLAKSTAPQCNRVAPNGDLIAAPERGMFMGNRTSPPRWLICDLHFLRDLKEPRKYKKLFFLDEAVALAGGHRPCNTCRRDSFQAYLQAVRSDLDIPGASDLDAKLNAARKAERRRLPIASLPDGAFVALDDGDYRIKWAGALRRWTPGGYEEPIADEQHIDEATILTPEPSLVALQHGYPVVVHPSAG